jgi:magnesium transporter
MLCFLDTKRIENINWDDDKEYLCIISFDELERYSKEIGIKKELIELWSKGITSKYESQYGFDYMSLLVPNKEELSNDTTRICTYFRKNLLLFITDRESDFNIIIKDIYNITDKSASLSKILYVVLDKLTVEDTYILDDLEQEISELEEAVLTSRDNHYLYRIMQLRKKLLNFKRYYEQFYNISEGIEENENGLIDKNTVKSFRIIKNRVNRLYSSVINLRDYVSQVREAYQAQVDISQNNLMKIFTVVTSVFLPLSLIVGWYGMNFNMPELSWEHGYSFVICLSVIVFIINILLFKKKKWF